MKLELNKEAARGLWLLVAALYFTSLYFLFDLTMGEGLIVAHYVENLVDYGQLSFNLGERIWAFTSPLHTLLVANYYWLTQHSVLTNKRVSVACVLATGLMSEWLKEGTVKEMVSPPRE